MLQIKSQDISASGRSILTIQFLDVSCKLINFMGVQYEIHAVPIVTHCDKINQEAILSGFIVIPIQLYLLKGVLTALIADFEKNCR